MAAEHFDIQPEDGWVEVTSSAVTFIRINQYPKNQPIFVTTGATPPAVDEVGFRVDCEDFYVDVAVADNFYVRVENPLQGQGTRIYVFTV